MFGLDDAIAEGLKLINKWVPDSTQAAAAENEWKLKVLELNAKSDSDQRDINKVEAANPSIFVAGWRPACGWVCVGALTYQVILMPVLSSFGFTPVPIDVEWASTLLYALLGIGGLRTVDKMAGTATTGVITNVINKIKGK